MNDITNSRKKNLVLLDIIANPEQSVSKSIKKKLTLEEMFVDYHDFYKSTEEDPAWLNISKIDFS